MVGFVNSLTILIFTAQLPTLIEVPWLVYPLVVVGILMVVMPCLTKMIPAPLVAIVLIMFSGAAIDRHSAGHRTKERPPDKCDGEGCESVRVRLVPMAGVAG